MHYRVGTRGSKLALVQTEYVIEKLKQAFPEDSFEAVIIKTSGDKDRTTALDAMGSKGIFTDEIEAQLLSGQIQLAVHSMKDMPEEPMDGLIFAEAWKREDPRDALILKDAASLAELNPGAVIGTGSKRRAFQLAKIRPDLRIVSIRGNVDTRIRKLREEIPQDGPRLDLYSEPASVGMAVPEMSITSSTAAINNTSAKPEKTALILDGIVLAAAGLKRLGRESEITEYLPPNLLIPAPAQGTLAIELRADNRELLAEINRLSDPQTARSVRLERGFLKAIGGDCHLPAAAYLSPEGNFYCLFGSSDGEKLARTRMKCPDFTDIQEEKVFIAAAVEEINRQLSRS